MERWTDNRTEAIAISSTLFLKKSVVIMMCLIVSNKRNLLYEDGIEKSVLRDHTLSSLGKPRDVKL